jgi:uncharacterized lipoprotein YmbA
MNKSLFLLAASLLVIMVGCSTTVPDEHQYLLRYPAANQNRQVTPSVMVGLGRISIPAYLNQAGVVLVSDQNQIHQANYHLWAEPLDKGIRIYLKSAIAQIAGFDIFATANNNQVWQYSVDIDLAEFHGTTAGQATLICSWRLIDMSGKEAPKSFEFATTQPLNDNGYPALVDAETKLLDTLAKTIAEQLKGLK